jgi:hypothetical protein
LNKRQKKISKVMGEFKDGALKSGGSDRKVTNPKQAIAIALSEAEGMNQGGMMYNQIMQRPMFQTPQQRQSMGIMAGVAPVRGYEEGGMAAPEYTPKFMRKEDSEEDGIGRMLFEFFIVDPDDPIDVGIASASAAMLAGGITAPGAVAAQLTRMGYKGKKLFDAINKVESLGKSSKPDAGIVRRTMAPVTGTIGATMTAREIPEIPSYVEAAGGIGDLVRDSVMNNQAQGYAMGGVAQLSGGGFLDGLLQLIPGKGRKAIDLLSEGIDAGRVAIDDILNALKRGDIEQREAEALVAKADKVLGEAGAETVEQGQRLVLKKPKMQAEDLATPPDSAIPTPPKPPAKVADDATEAAEEAAKKKPSVGRQIATGTGKAAGIAGGAGVASDIGLGTNFISTGLEKIGDAYGTVRDDVAATLAMPEIVALRERVNPDTGERVELTESAQARLPEVETARQEGFPEPPTAAPATTQEKVETGTPKPEATGIMKFLFGKDGIGGEPGALGMLGDKLNDPRTQYALARASQPTEGFVPRNFFSDFTLAGQEYDEQQAKIKSLEGDDTTALMQNYEFLKQAGKSDDEIFDLLLSKDTASDQAERYQDQVLSLFNAARKDPNNTGRSTAELLEEARSTAAAIILNQSVATPTDSEAIETVDLE